MHKSQLMNSSGNYSRAHCLLKLHIITSHTCRLRLLVKSQQPHTLRQALSFHLPILAGKHYKQREQTEARKCTMNYAHLQC